MGCGKSSAAKADDSQTQVKDIRRRLSVGHVDEGQDDATNTEATEEDRGLITSLAQETVIEMLSKGGQDGDRKFSIGSNTDMSKTSFANKTMQQIGDEVDPAANGLGFTCRKGLKPESPNQDSWSVLKVDGNFSLYGVYDGHGKQGHDVSNFVKENLPKLIIRDQRFKTDQMEGMLKDNFRKMQSLINTSDRLKKLSAQMSGTTATVVIHDHNENKLTVSHVADSTCVLGRYTDASKSELEGFALTTDHKPDLPAEKARIEKAGGRVVFDGYANHRIYAKNTRYPGLNMSRCLGDLLGHQDAGCSCEPDVSTRKIDPLDHVLLLCSDGVWEFISAQEAVKIVCEFPPAKAMVAAERLAKEAWDRWMLEEQGTVVDDITVVLIYLQQVSKR
eukprot:gnl/TRDRNA2_/TRDRNA2_176555_c0_seq4.p1 gnl/TRDRNA2_/TRDRNA2_176555_c0~~gnl/TRDRNA2_/TRDRNA2_176555_c0_seq4.p1  ORF type:complete len:390 (+),score=76.60 gnl/TRDRNA2_/TRDRNA2_176555_c0_seq4:93-1262(+)